MRAVGILDRSKKYLISEKSPLIMMSPAYKRKLWNKLKVIKILLPKYKGVIVLEKD